MHFGQFCAQSKSITTKCFRFGVRKNSVLCSRYLRLWTKFFFFFFVFRSRTTRRYIRHGRRLPADEATSSKNATLQRLTPETHVLLQQRLSEVLVVKEGIAPTSVLRHTTENLSTHTQCPPTSAHFSISVPSGLDRVSINFYSKRRRLLANISHKRGQASVHLNKTECLITRKARQVCHARDRNTYGGHG